MAPNLKKNVGGPTTNPSPTTPGRPKSGHSPALSVLPGQFRMGLSAQRPGSRRSQTCGEKDEWNCEEMRPGADRYWWAPTVINGVIYPYKWAENKWCFTGVLTNPNSLWKTLEVAPTFFFKRKDQLLYP